MNINIRLLPLILIVFVISSSFTSVSPHVKEEKIETIKKDSGLDEEAYRVLELYEDFKIKNTSVPQLESFSQAIKGYSKLEATGRIKNKTLTIIDFSLHSSKKRLWVLDMQTHKVLFNTVVAHGRNTGLEFAKYFSNTNNSNQSSLGFYITGETYYGKNGLSMFLDGQEKGFNNNARKRYVVFHGAKYANPDFVKRNGRLGRSLGCPAVPTAVNKAIISKIKNKSCLFIYHPNKKYQTSSKLIS
ncbi:murein L,D-transpeptidase catalytic domain family protein [Pseudofulvibacter geojedonensis]|uniref:Murein L,D-transpeptidase catalytic domain family protein n=1 Tax=Pseudofulvibacter geojedonensis TaxID=1123758 RepID=A0ABW3I0P5_9FLAO